MVASGVSTKGILSSYHFGSGRPCAVRIAAGSRTAAPLPMGLSSPCPLPLPGTRLGVGRFSPRPALLPSSAGVAEAPLLPGTLGFSAGLPLCETRASFEFVHAPHTLAAAARINVLRVAARNGTPSAR